MLQFLSAESKNKPLTQECEGQSSSRYHLRYAETPHILFSLNAGHGKAYMALSQLSGSKATFRSFFLKIPFSPGDFSLTGNAAYSSFSPPFFMKFTIISILQIVKRDSAKFTYFS